MTQRSRQYVPALAAVMLVAASLVLFIGAFGAEQPLGNGGTKSFDPWSPDRKFCGRLTIHLNGAGEMSQSKYVTLNMLGEFTIVNCRDFYGRVQSPMPSLSLVMSSDVNVQRAVNKLAAKEKKLLGGAVFPSSEDAFGEFLSNDASISLLEKAIDYFSKTATCRALMGQEESVIPSLKTEIVIETDHAPGGIPVWSKKGDTGSLDSYYQQDNPKVIGSELFLKVRDHLGNGVVQIFVDSCQGSKIVEDLRNNNQC